MSMMWVTPARATAAMFSAFQIPPPTAMRPVTQVMSILKAPRNERGCATGRRVGVPAQLPKVADKRSAASYQRLAVVAQLLAFILKHPRTPRPQSCGIFGNSCVRRRRPEYPAFRSSVAANESSTGPSSAEVDLEKVFHPQVVAFPASSIVVSTMPTAPFPTRSAICHRISARPVAFRWVDFVVPALRPFRTCGFRSQFRFSSFRARPHCISAKEKSRVPQRATETAR